MNKIKKIKIDYNEIPLKEYPRPQLTRESYLSLNGDWEYAIIDAKDRNEKVDFKNHIMVPYAVESPLSGVNHLLRPDEIIIYNKLVKLPKDFKKQVLMLHFEGVDQICDVYINNQKVGSHIGGYCKFALDITKYALDDDFYISVVCVDKTDSSFHSRGKQALKRGGIFYTSSSGIFKSVWLEALPYEYIKDIRYTTLFKEKCLRMFIEANRDGVCMVKINNQEILMNANQETLIKLETFHVWSIDDPYLYNVSVRFFDDNVRSYFGLRNIEINYASDGFPRLYLNGKLTFIKGVLDQGYYYLGNLTPQTHMDYLNEITDLKALGYNTIRKHIKTEDDLFYYYCDTKGMLVIQDFINGGTRYSKLATFFPGLLPDLYKIKDNKYKTFGRENAEGQTEWINESKQIQKELYSHPSVIIYTIFNEGWGQFDSKLNYKRFKNNDPTRLYDTTSGWVDFGASDFKSVHNYFYKNRVHKDEYKENRPQFLSEYGGYGLYLEDHFYGKDPWCYKTFKDTKTLSNEFENLHKTYILPMISKGLMGTIYTQVSDVEDEINGLYTFDRKILKINKASIQHINKLIDIEYSKIK